MTTIIASFILGAALACGAYTGWLLLKDAMDEKKRGQK